MPLHHPFAPIWTPQSRTLILGTFPSLASRGQGFYYAHPRNRFWPVLAALFEESLPRSIDEKTALILRRNLALWDVLASCEIAGSADASIRRPVANDIAALLEQSAIEKICCNGKTAYALYKKHCDAGIPVVCLPSTSPANAAWDMGRLLRAWGAIL